MWERATQHLHFKETSLFFTHHKAFYGGNLSATMRAKGYWGSFWLIPTLTEYFVEISSLLPENGAVVCFSGPQTIQERSRYLLFMEVTYWTFVWVPSKNPGSAQNKPPSPSGLKWAEGMRSNLPDKGSSPHFLPKNIRGMLKTLSRSLRLQVGALNLSLLEACCLLSCRNLHAQLLWRLWFPSFLARFC